MNAPTKTAGERIESSSGCGLISALSVFLLLAAPLGAGCLKLNINNTLGCSSGGKCPSPYQCVNGLCLRDPPSCGTCPTGMGCVDQVCQTPVCTTFNYSPTPYTEGSREGLEDVVIAVSNGETLVYGQTSAASSATCGSFNVFVADETASDSGTYTHLDLTPWVTANGIIDIEMGMSGDGLTLVVLSADRTSFASAKRSRLQLVDFGTLSRSEFTAVNDILTGTNGTFREPVISSDGREFYFTINGISAAADGIYRSVRASDAILFSVPTRLSVLTSDYEYVTGVSSDRLTLFVFKEFVGFIFTRSSTDLEFANPNAPNAPPEISGWQHKPFQDCKKLFLMAGTAGGCQNEDLYFDDRAE